MVEQNKWAERTILIAEDAETSIQYFRAALLKSGVKILWADNGVDAVKLTKEHPEIELILMDLDLPIMDGLQATKQIKELRPKLPVVAQTAHVLLGDAESCMEAGCDGYITKPISLEVLISTVEGFLNG